MVALNQSSWTHNSTNTIN